MAKSRKKRPTKAQMPSVHVIKRWLENDVAAVGRHSLVLMSESNGTRSSILDDLRATVRDHYVDPKNAAKRIASLGAPKTAKLLSILLPESKRARSGDLGEVLATEVAEQHLGFKVPIRRLRWKDDPNMALRGDDVIGLAREKKNKKLAFLKSEAKSRASLTKTPLKKADETLNKDCGRPTRHSVLFMAQRLREQGRDELAKELEDAVLQGFTGMRVEHMLFVLTGNDPKELLTEHLKTKLEQKCCRHAIGLHIKDYEEFIKDLFEGL